MADQGSYTRGLRVKKEVVCSGSNGADKNGGENDRFAAAAAAALAKGEKRSNVAGFLAKAYQIFDNPAWADICGWGDGGETVVIRKQIEFAQCILPLFFSHSNLQSFVRQLNMYNFRKVVQDPNSGEFKHDLFRKGNEHLLHKIKRKQGASGGGSSALPRNGKYRVEGTGSSGSARVAGAASDIIEEASNVLDELVKLRKWKETMENTVVELKRDKQTLQSENQMLKAQVAERGQHQQVLQSKMQKILYCMYDAYNAGLPALTAAGEGHWEVTGDATTRGQEGSIVAAGANAARPAWEKALKQLAALADANIASKLDQLEMENPWTMGDEGGGGRGAHSSTAYGVNGGTSGDGVNVVGGGSLKRNRTWSQTSYEWLKSLRDPDPLDTIGSAGSLTAEVGGMGSGIPRDGTFGRNDLSSNADSSSSSDDRDPDNVARVTPERGAAGTSTVAATITAPAEKRQRISVPIKAEAAGAAPVAAAGVDRAPSPSAAATSRPPSPPPATVAAPAAATAGTSSAVDAGSNAAAAAATAAARRQQGAHIRKMASFQANAPLPKGISFSGFVEDSEAGTRCSVAAAGGRMGCGEVWGGGALSKTMSEGATQVVNELGELGHREGEALTKIDSLGYQLATLLDPNTSFDDMPLFESMDNEVQEVDITQQHGNVSSRGVTEGLSQGSACTATGQRAEGGRGSTQVR